MSSTLPFWYGTSARTVCVLCCIFYPLFLVWFGVNAAKMISAVDPIFALVFIPAWIGSAVLLTRMLKWMLFRPPADNLRNMPFGVGVLAAIITGAVLNMVVPPGSTGGPLGESRVLLPFCVMAVFASILRFWLRPHLSEPTQSPSDAL